MVFTLVDQMDLGDRFAEQNDDEFLRIPSSDISCLQCL